MVKTLVIPIPFSDDTRSIISEQRHIVARIDALFTELAEMRGLNQTIQSDVDRLMDAVYEDAYPDQHGYIPDGWEIKTFEMYVKSTRGVRRLEENLTIRLLLCQWQRLTK